MQGYIVNLGTNGVLGTGDSISGTQVTFTPQGGAVASGAWQWTGVYSVNGQSYQNINDTGQFYVVNSGGVDTYYFVPDTYYIDSGSASVTVLQDETVEGTSGNDVIDNAYTGDPDGEFVSSGADTIIAGGGNDTVFANGGDDYIDGGTGNDDLNGGAGDDTIIAGSGDDTVRGDTAGETRAAFQWANLADPDSPGAIDNGDELTGTATQVTGGTTITYTYAASPTGFPDGSGGTDTPATFTTLDEYVAGINTGSDQIDTRSALWIGGDLASSSAILDFADEVNNVSFRVNDIDFNTGGFTDRVTVRAWDNNGNPITVNLTGASGLTLSDTDGVAGNDAATANGGLTDADDASSSVLVNIPGPVGRIEVIYSDVLQTGDDGLVNVTDIYFDAIGETGGDDSIAGGAGDDTLFGETGDDIIAGGADDDEIYGGAGEDTLSGDAGTDTLFGGTGSDQFNVSDNHNQDTIIGGEDTGNGDIDIVDFSSTATSQGVSVDYTGDESGTYDYDGTTGAGSFDEIERVETTNFDDTIDGTGATTGINVGTNDGDDSIIGSAGTDTIDAGTGADTIEGGAGDDIIDLGGPDGDPDLLVFSDDDGTDTVANFDAPIDNGDGTYTGIDMLDVSDLSDLGGDPVNTNDVTVSGPAGGPATLTFPGGEQIILQGITPAELDNPFALHAIGIPLPDGTVSGGAGDDLIDGSYLGDPDGDIVDNDDAILPGDAANDDLIEGNGGNDSVLAGDGDDEIYGGTGNDTIDGGADDDTIFGEAGDDTAVLTANFGDDTYTGGESGETTGDMIDATALTQNTTVIFSGDEQGTVTQGTNSVDFVEVERIETGSGDDNVFGGTGNDSVDTGAGDDTVYIADNFGDDTFNAGEVNDAQGDVLDGAALTQDVTVTFDGPESGDIANGSDTIDFAEFEELATGSGDDTIFGGTGNDSVATNGGDDIIAISDNFGNDTFDGGAPGQTVGDRLDGSALTGDATVDFTGPEEGQLFVGTDTADFSEIEVVATGSGDDTINSGAGNDTVETNGGDDSFVVADGFGNDSFLAGEGGELSGDDIDATAINTDTTVVFDGPEFGTLTTASDSLEFAEVEQVATGSGDDAILSGTGNDTVSTNGGDDTYYVQSNFGDDSFTAGETGESTGDYVNTTLLSEDVTVTFSGPEAGTLTEGGNTLNFSEVEGVETGSGDDTILAGSGNDIAFTNAGDDTFAITDGFGDDVFIAGEAGETNGDTLDGSALTVDAAVVLDGVESGSLTTGADTVTFAQVENVITGSGDDYVVGGAGDENVITGAGDDTVSGGLGSDTIDTGAGADTITFAEGDSISSGSGDDTFTLEDLGETGNGPINIDGGDEDSATGDTLALGDLADLSTLVTTDDGTGSLSGSVTLDDGTLLTFQDIETVICFTPGTLIATPQGARDIATLQVGDPVLTRDHGIQPIRWIESRTVEAQDNFAPIRIRPGVITGQQDDLLVSPQHRMLFQGYRAELLFGETEVLVAAKHLVDDHDVTEETGGKVTYIHMMFDQHEVVYANGAASESFHPGSVGLTGVSEAAREELFALFPELRSDPAHYGKTARRCLKPHETQLLKL